MKCAWGLTWKMAMLTCLYIILHTKWFVSDFICMHWMDITPWGHHEYEHKIKWREKNKVTPNRVDIDVCTMKEIANRRWASLHNYAIVIWSCRRISNESENRNIFNEPEEKQKKFTTKHQTKRNATKPNKTKPNAIDINEELHTHTHKCFAGLIY